MSKKGMILAALCLAGALTLAACAAKPAASSSSASTGSETVSTGVANPWSEAATLEEAAANAGIDGLDLAQGITISLGEVKPGTIRSMKGMIEVNVEYPAVQLCLRKGIGAGDEDISGDYNEYAQQWTQTVKGLEVRCSGSVEEQAQKVLWSAGKYAYSVTVTPLGGEDKLGLSPDDINSLINGIQ